MESRSGREKVRGDLRENAREMKERRGRGSEVVEEE